MGKTPVLLNPTWMILGEHKADEFFRSSLCPAARAVMDHGAVPQVGQLLQNLSYPFFPPKKKVSCSALSVEGVFGGAAVPG